MRGAREFAAALGRVPKAVESEVRRALEQGAAEAVAIIDALAPPALKGRTKWVWGRPPRGRRALVSVGEDGTRLQLTIFVENPAKGGGGEDARAHWFEFGTGERVQATTGRRTGRMPATPFFYPGWRLVRNRARARIARAMGKGIRKAMGQ